jgi:hypothetical protein
MLLLTGSTLLLIMILLSIMDKVALAHEEDFQQPYAATNSKKMVYVCITGQLSRLELANKINKLLKPLHKLGYSMNIGLALTTDTSHFTNINNGDKMRLTTSIRQVTRWLLNVAGVEEVRHFLPQHSKDMYANLWYKAHLDNDNSISRVQNHARQYKTLQYCNEWSNIAQVTELTVRIRDDVLFERIDVPDIVHQTLHSAAVVTSTCDAWAGINDKVAFLPSSKAQQFFHSPYEKYLTFDAKIPALNPEKYYNYVYSELGYPLQSVSSLYVSKAVTQLIPPGEEVASTWVSRIRRFMNISKSRGDHHHASGGAFCRVSSNAHKSFSPGCDAAFASDVAGTPVESTEKPGTYLSSPSFGVSYETKCW